MEAAGVRGHVKAVIWILILTAIVPTRADSDLWGNVRFGMDLLTTRSLSTVDPYSFTQDVPWINHSWLPQVAMAIAYSHGGTAGLVILKVLLAGATLWIVAGAFARSAHFVREAAVVFVLLAALPLFATLRAQLWTCLGLAILCRLILSRKPWAMAWSPALLVVWVNSHVGWILGIAILIWWAIGWLVRGPAPERYRATAIAAASFAATLVNPYGWHIWQFAFGVAHLSRDITEWQPLSEAPLLDRLTFVACVALVALVHARIRPRMPLERLSYIAGLAYASLRAIKFTSLFVVASVMFLAPAIVARYPARVTNDRRTSQGVRVVNAAMVAALLAVVIISSWPRLNCIEADDWRPDPTAVRALLDANAAGRIAVTFDWGEYVIWHFGPKLQVSYDPRYDLIYSPRTIAEQVAVLEGAPEGLAFLERTRPEYVWFRQSSSRLKAGLPANGYRIDIDTPESFVAVRADVAPLHDPGPQTFGCFPSP